MEIGMLHEANEIEVEQMVLLEILMYLRKQSLVASTLQPLVQEKQALPKSTEGPD